MVYLCSPCLLSSLRPSLLLFSLLPLNPQALTFGQQKFILCPVSQDLGIRLQVSQACPCFMELSIRAKATDVELTRLEGIMVDGVTAVQKISRQAVGWRRRDRQELLSVGWPLWEMAVCQRKGAERAGTAEPSQMWARLGWGARSSPPGPRQQGGWDNILAQRRLSGGILISLRTCNFSYLAYI